MPAPTWHLAAYSGAVGQTANTDVPAVQDQVLTISNNHFRLIDNQMLLGAACLSATASRARLDSPTLRIPGNPYLRPINVGALPITRQALFDLRANPYPLPAREEIAFQETITLACGTETSTGLIWVGQAPTPIPPGRVQWVRLTSTTAAVAATWTQVALTFESALPVGYWSVVGLEYQATHAIAARFIFPGGFYRPGVMGVTALANLQEWGGYSYAWGEFGRFVNDNPFQIQVYNTGTDAAHEFYVALVNVNSL